MDEPSPHLRAADADRERVAEQLRVALGEGRLTLEEFDERVAAVYAARTYGDLAAVTSDLPRSTVSEVDLGKAPARSGGTSGHGSVQRRHHSVHRTHPIGVGWGSWLSVNSLLVVIWLLTAVLGDGDADPWFLWVAVPWGAALLVRDVQHRLR